MTTFYSLLSMLLAFGYWLLIAGVTLRILMKRRSVPSVTAWLLIVYILPLVGVIAYVLFGELHLGQKRAQRAHQMWPTTKQWLAELKDCPNIFCTKSSSVAEPLFQLCEQRQGIPAIRENKLQILTSTDETMQAMINDINGAKESIDIVFYIWHSGGIPDDVAQALMDASQRGVRCRLMVDSAGSFRFLRGPYPKKMREAGIQVVEALQVNIFRLFLRRMDLRQHRKMVMIDNHIAYTGSMNMVDPRFFKQDAGVGQWIDLMARMEGPVASVMNTIYACDWEMETDELILPEKPVQNIIAPDEIGHAVHIIPSGPGFPENMIHQAHLTAVYSARKQLVLTTPYFVPSDDLLHAICTAALRGVDVSVIVPKKNDSTLVAWASKAFFTELLEAGVKIYEFTDGLLHTKCVIVDSQLTLVGTVNLDIRSLWLNFEVTAVIDDAQFGAEMMEIQEDYISRSTLIDFEQWQQRPVWKRIVERLYYFLSPLL